MPYDKKNIINNSTREYGLFVVETTDLYQLYGYKISDIKQVMITSSQTSTTKPKSKVPKKSLQVPQQTPCLKCPQENPYNTYIPTLQVQSPYLLMT